MDEFKLGNELQQYEEIHEETIYSSQNCNITPKYLKYAETSNKIAGINKSLSLLGKYFSSKSSATTNYIFYRSNINYT